MGTALQRHRARQATHGVQPQTAGVPITSGEGELYRFNSQSLLVLEKQLASPHCNQLTTDIQAGYLLGIQHVLQLLRTGFTVG